MKNIQLFGFLLVLAAFTVCNKAAALPTVKITEFQRKIKDEYKPMMSFLYNESGGLTKMELSHWDNEGEPSALDTYVFERGDNNEVTKATCKLQYYLNGQWETEANINYALTYNNGDIVEVAYSEGDESGVVLYEWADGKVVTVKRDGATVAELKYSKGNYMGYDQKGKDETPDGEILSYTQKIKYEYGSDKNIYRYMPVEALVFMKFGEIDGVSMSNNNVVSSKLSSVYRRTDMGSGKAVLDGENKRDEKFVYSYDTDGMVNGYTTGGSSLVIIKDHKDSKNNENSSKTVVPELYKIVTKSF